ncbi:MAG: PHP-associated domain-containing protein [Candidatus Helarchaeota archaeon]
MLIDMHVHTKPKSPCSNITPEEAIKEAINVGLDGIILTEHNIIWSDSEIQKLRDKFDILILKGIEITTIEGDILIYNYNFNDIDDIPHVQEVRNKIGNNKNSFIALAHPFREFLVVGIGDLGIDMDEILNRPVLNIIDGIEVLNGQVSRKANRLAKTVSKKKGLFEIGGSDAHELDQIGKCITEFEANTIKDEIELVNELFNGNYKVKYFRK